MVTPEGRAELRRWLVDVEPDRTVRDETMLRALLISTLGTEDALKVLEREENVLTPELRDLRTFLDQQAKSENPTDPMMMGLDLRVRMIEAMLGWITEARRRILAQR
ncbi:hypothetical protein GCM10029964_027460 [Kibdelosporangium lantanae]